MKKYKRPEERRKSWSLKLAEGGSNIYLNAVDSDTGVGITTLLIFEKGGRVKRGVFAESELVNNGYNAQEHGNKWDRGGRLVID